jgi:protein TonB
MDAPGARRTVSFLAVASLHALLIGVLLSQSDALRVAMPAALHIRILPARPQRRPPPRIAPALTAPALETPLPALVMGLPAAGSTALHAVTQAPAAAHFGAALGDAGLGLDVAAAAGGGASIRGTLADFEAAVKRAVLTHKQQPALAWDRRNTCVVNYAVAIRENGDLARLSIDACAVPEINQAARDAIQAAAPFPRPPGLGALEYTVHGSLIFRP